MIIVSAAALLQLQIDTPCREPSRSLDSRLRGNDELKQTPTFVIPAQAGIQQRPDILAVEFRISLTFGSPPA
ncbi:hypothetical protein [Croceibacterium xixiisoli]|uniref:hypothetical protein n=1 Tax=Croceibacterium xixiisoli TaxID=1476466 RepID=UPI00136C808D|nr:hypothetical protein [Croceibacterium xixiisoli]